MRFLPAFGRALRKSEKVKKMKLSKQDRLNLIDTLLEWDEEIGPKELGDNEVGLNFERYSDIMQRLIDSISARED